MWYRFWKILDLRPESISDIRVPRYRAATPRKRDAVTLRYRRAVTPRNRSTATPPPRRTTLPHPPPCHPATSPPRHHAPTTAPTDTATYRHHHAPPTAAYRRLPPPTATYRHLPPPTATYRHVPPPTATATYRHRHQPPPVETDFAGPEPLFQNFPRFQNIPDVSPFQNIPAVSRVVVYEIFRIFWKNGLKTIQDIFEEWPGSRFFQNSPDMPGCFGRSFPT